MKKFYVGANSIGLAIAEGRDAACMHDTIEEAVQDAKKKLKSRETDICVIVQVIKIVRKEVPIVVEDVS